MSDIGYVPQRILNRDRKNNFEILTAPYDKEKVVTVNGHQYVFELSGREREYSDLILLNDK